MAVNAVALGVAALGAWKWIYSGLKQQTRLARAKDSQSETKECGIAGVPPRIRHLLRHELHELDTKMSEFLRVLDDVGAAEYWHKTGTFHHHLVSVWRVLQVWNQSEAGW